MASSSNSPDKDPKINLSVHNEFETRKIELGLDQADEEKMCIETLIQSPDKDPKKYLSDDDDKFEQQKVVLGLSAFAHGVDRADEEKMCIETAPLPKTLIQSSDDDKDPENMSDDNKFEKQKIVQGLPAVVGSGVDRADEKKMYIGRKRQLTALSQSMASSSNSLDKDPENLSDDEFEERQIVPGSPAVEKTCIGIRNFGVSWGFIQDQGGRKHMEDHIVMYPDFMWLRCDTFGGCTAPKSKLPLADESLIHYFGVFDGHGGNEVRK
ncbi:protein phosphatase 2C [Tanacetum coccineum]